MQSERLTPPERRRYGEDGYLVRPSRFDDRELAALRRAARASVRKAQAALPASRQYVLDGNRFFDIDDCTVQLEHGAGEGVLRVIETVHQFHPRWEALIDDPRLTEPMRDILGSESISLWTNKLNVKSAFGSGFGWHQDSPYWMHDSSQVDRLPNVFLALYDCTVANGCLAVIAGSHAAGMLPGCSDDRQLAGFYTDPSAFDSSRKVCLEVPRGSLIFFDPHLVHGSEPSRSRRRRTAIILTYQPGQRPMLKSGLVRPVKAGACHALSRRGDLHQDQAAYDQAGGADTHHADRFSEQEDPQHERSQGADPGPDHVGSAEWQTAHGMSQQRETDDHGDDGDGCRGGFREPL